MSIKSDARITLTDMAHRLECVENLMLDEYSQLTREQLEQDEGYISRIREAADRIHTRIIFHEGQRAAGKAES